MGEQLRNSSSKIFLIGIGHAQQALLHRMKKYRDAVFIVIGRGIDALAGTIYTGNDPYMANLVCFQLRDFDYTTINLPSLMRRKIQTITNDIRVLKSETEIVIRLSAIYEFRRKAARKLEAHIKTKRVPHHRINNSHYPLLTYLASQIHNGKIVELGTQAGFSALALSTNKTNRVLTYDVVDVFNLRELSNVERRIGNIFEIGEEEELLDADLVFVDTEHTGEFEKQVYDYLVKNHYRGLLLLDDIHLNDDMEEFWKSITTTKHDITQIGHNKCHRKHDRICGTGLVDFSGRVQISGLTSYKQL